MRWLFWALSLVALATAPASAGSQARGNVFEIEAKIYDAQGQLIGNPHFRALAGAEVVTAYQDVNGYGLRFTIDDDSTASSQVDRVNIQSRLYMPFEGQWRLVGQPQARMAVGGRARIADQSGYTVEFHASRQNITLTANDVSPVTDCPMFKALGDSEPLAGVRVVGLRLVRTAVQDSDQVGEDPTAGNCCTDGRMRCCGTPGDGVCCSDPTIPASCCVPS